MLTEWDNKDDFIADKGCIWVGVTTRSSLKLAKNCPHRDILREVARGTHKNGDMSMSTPYEFNEDTGLQTLPDVMARY